MRYRADDVLELPVRLEIHHGPAGEIERILAKGEVDHSLDKAAIVQCKQDRRLTTEPVFSGAGRCPSQDRMCERAADRGDGGIYFLLGRAHDPSVDGSRRLNRMGTGVEVDRRQDGVDKRAEAPSAWPLESPRSTVSTSTRG